MARVTKEIRGKIFLARSIIAVPISFISFVHPASLNCTEHEQLFTTSTQTESTTTSYSLIFFLTAFLEEDIFRKYSKIIIVCINYNTR